MADESDVLIVGAGVAGSLIAWRLARTGARVTIVEAGPEVDRGTAVDRYKQAAVRVPEAPYRMRPYAEYPATIDDTYIRQDGPEPFRSTYLRQVGGTTWHWLGTALRLLPHDLELRSRYGVGVDWPLSLFGFSRPGTTQPKPNSPCRAMPTRSDRRARSLIPCRDCRLRWATG